MFEHGFVAEVSIKHVRQAQFLLASDGLTRLIEDAELRAILLAMQPAEAVEKLIVTVLERGAPDNVSIILVKVA